MADPTDTKITDWKGDFNAGADSNTPKDTDTVGVYLGKQARVLKGVVREDIDRGFATRVQGDVSVVNLSYPGMVDFNEPGFAPNICDRAFTSADTETLSLQEARAAKASLSEPSRGQGLYGQDIAIVVKGKDTWKRFPAFTGITLYTRRSYFETVNSSSGALSSPQEKFFAHRMVVLESHTVDSIKDKFQIQVAGTLASAETLDTTFSDHSVIYANLPWVRVEAHPRVTGTPEVSYIDTAAEVFNDYLVVESTTSTNYDSGVTTPYDFRRSVDYVMEEADVVFQGDTDLTEPLTLRTVWQHDATGSTLDGSTYSLYLSPVLRCVEDNSAVDTLDPGQTYAGRVGITELTVAKNDADPDESFRTSRCAKFLAEKLFQAATEPATLPTFIVKEKRVYWMMTDNRPTSRFNNYNVWRKTDTTGQIFKDTFVTSGVGEDLVSLSTIEPDAITGDIYSNGEDLTTQTGEITIVPGGGGDVGPPVVDGYLLLPLPKVWPAPYLSNGDNTKLREPRLHFQVLKTNVKISNYAGSPEKEAAYGTTDLARATAFRDSHTFSTAPVVYDSGVPIAHRATVPTITSRAPLPIGAEVTVAWSLVTYPITELNKE